MCLSVKLRFLLQLPPGSYSKPVREGISVVFESEHPTTLLLQTCIGRHTIGNELMCGDLSTESLIAQYQCHWFNASLAFRPYMQENVFLVNYPTHNVLINI